THLRKYLLISSAIQIIFVVLDLSVGKITGHLEVIRTVQIFNYAVAGLCLFLTIGVFVRKKTFIYELEGSVNTDKWNDAFATIACLSLAGLPAFNIFVSKWALFTSAYEFSPSLTLFGIFATLLLFIMYYKIVYVLLVGGGKKQEAPKAVTVINGALAAMVIALGVIPQIQWWLLPMVN
ncbi:MAG: proton-conducting transporter membrane subunit, partial [archaeon]